MQFKEKELHYVYLGQYEEAIKWHNKALTIDENDHNSLNNKGLVLYNLGHYREALNYYNKALEQIPGDLDMIASKAGILGLGLDKYTDTLKLINSYLKENPNHTGLMQ